MGPLGWVGSLTIASSLAATAAEQDAPPRRGTNVRENAQQLDVLVVSNGVGQRGSRPVAVTVRFEDGSTQEIDISSHAFLTIDVNRRQVILGATSSAWGGPGWAGSAERAHADALEPIPPGASGLPTAYGPPDLPAAPVRVPLPDGFVPDAFTKKRAVRAKDKAPAKIRDKTVDKTAPRASAEERLRQLEKTLRQLQLQIESLKETP